jgi:hypothetical protein
VVVTGLLALWWPVYLDQYDQYGVRISCGRGFLGNLSHDVVAGSDGGSIVDRCDTALLIRRAWAIPLAVVGWLVLTGLLVSWLHAPPRKDEPART